MIYGILINLDNRTFISARCYCGHDLCFSSHFLRVYNIYPREQSISILRITSQLNSYYIDTAFHTQSHPYILSWRLINPIQTHCFPIRSFIRNICNWSIRTVCLQILDSSVRDRQARRKHSRRNWKWVRNDINREDKRNGKAGGRGHKERSRSQI